MDRINIQGASGSTSRPFVFTGSGSAYFRIWIVNWLLTLLTLGVYSAWAKVRRLKYFHQSTTLAGAGFDYHGKPLDILKGRVIGLLALLLVSLVPFAILPFLILLPMLLRSAMRFRLHNTSYRGLRFGFTGTPRGAYFVFLLGALLIPLSLGLLTPYFYKKMKEYQHANARYGTEYFIFDATTSAFYGLYAKTSLVMIGSMAAIGLFAGGLLPSLDTFRQFLPDAGEMMDPAQAEAFFMLIMVLVIAFNIVLMLLIAPYFQSRSQNLIWGGTHLGQHFIRSRVRARGLAWIYVSNTLLVLLTLGFFAPWASVRLARYRVQSLSLQSFASLDGFLADQQADSGALGQETAEWFDIDIGL